MPVSVPAAAASLWRRPLRNVSRITTATEGPGAMASSRQATANAASVITQLVLIAATQRRTGV
jgi:hypothetical protein